MTAAVVLGAAGSLVANRYTTYVYVYMYVYVCVCVCTWNTHANAPGFLQNASNKVYCKTGMKDFWDVLSIIIFWYVLEVFEQQLQTVLMHSYV